MALFAFVSVSYNRSNRSYRNLIENHNATKRRLYILIVAIEDAIVIVTHYDLSLPFPFQC